jgi:hypothetical protein
MSENVRRKEDIFVVYKMATCGESLHARVEKRIPDDLLPIRASLCLHSRFHATLSRRNDVGNAVNILIPVPSVLIIPGQKHDHAGTDPFARRNSTTFLHLKISQCTGKEHWKWRVCRSWLQSGGGDYIFRTTSCWLPRLSIFAGYLLELLRLDRRRFHRHQAIRT